MAEELILDVAGLTDVGLKRKRNEDFYDYKLPPPDSEQFKQYGAFFVVADGMGGMGGGDAASQTAVKEMVTRYYDPVTSDISPLGSLKAALEAANVAVREKAKEMGVARIGTTGAGLVLQPDGDVVLWNVGDSRVYRIRKNYIELLTRDQSVLQGQIDGGLISEEDARQARNVNVTAFIGQPMPLQPVFHRTQPQTGDVFVICSDGLWDLVEPHELLNTIQHTPAKDAAKVLINLARERGGPDNITVIIVRFGPPPKTSRPAWLGMRAVAAVVAVIALAVVLFLLFGGGDDGDSGDTTTASAAPTTETVEVTATTDLTATSESSAGVLTTDEPTDTPEPTVIDSQTATRQATDEPTETASDMPTEPTETEPTAVSGVIVFTNTPTDIPTATDTPEPSDTPTITPTNTPVPTRTFTRTPTKTSTPEPSDTPVPTDTLTVTATATNTSEPTDTPEPTNTPTRTLTATATKPPTLTLTSPPTVTLNPTVITWTPTSSPTPQPTLRPEAQMMLLAAEQGVRLTEDTTLYAIFTLEVPNPRIISQVTLPAGTTVMMIGGESEAITSPIDPQVELFEVRVVDDTTDSGGYQVGWISRDALENAETLVPLARGLERGANIRTGDDESFDRKSTLKSGQTAEILGVSSRGTGWLYIKTESGLTGWVAPWAVDVLGDISDLPMYNPPTLIVPTEPVATTAPTQASVPGNPPANQPPANNNNNDAPPPPPPDIGDLLPDGSEEDGSG